MSMSGRSIGLGLFEFLNCLMKFFRKQQRNKFRGFSPPANYTDPATSACRRSANFSG
jgi:hypothetical protein